MQRLFVFLLYIHNLATCHALICPIYLPQLLNSRSRSISICTSNNNCTFSQVFGKTDACLGVYFNYSGQILIKQLGILHSDEQCLTNRQCYLETDELNPKTFSCCCSTDNCTLDWQIISTTTTRRSNSFNNSSLLNVIRIEENFFPWIWIISTIVCIIVIILLMCSFGLWRSLRNQERKKKEDQSLSESITSALVEQLFFTAQQPITGKNSIVYKASSDNDTVALKVYTQTNVLMWKNEVTLLKSINLLSEGQYSSHLYLVLPYYEHGTLQSYLRRVNQGLSMDQCLNFLRSLVSAISYLHSGYNSLHTTIVHRDIKSSNILVSNHNFTLCLTDFGIAFALPRVLMKTDFIQIGTTRYMAPELLEGVIAHTREGLCSVDMYALALVMWEITTQCHIYPKSVYRPPFDEYITTNPEDLPLSTQIYNIVVVRRLRPTFLPPYNDEQHSSTIQELRSLIEACWTTDAEIRMTSQTLEFKLNQLIESPVR